jgi:hypothetical protein
MENPKYPEDFARTKKAMKEEDASDGDSSDGADAGDFIEYAVERATKTSQLAQLRTRSDNLLQSVVDIVDAVLRSYRDYELKLPQGDPNKAPLKARLDFAYAVKTNIYNMVVEVFDATMRVDGTHGHNSFQKWKSLSLLSILLLSRPPVHSAPLNPPLYEIYCFISMIVNVFV